MRRPWRPRQDGSGEQAPAGPGPLSELGRRVGTFVDKARARAADHQFEHSAAGRARAAAAKGDTIFQYRPEMTEWGHGAELSAIEAEGWKLESTDIQTETVTDTDPDGSARSRTVTYAFYQFTREPDPGGD